MIGRPVASASRSLRQPPLIGPARNLCRPSSSALPQRAAWRRGDRRTSPAQRCHPQRAWTPDDRARATRESPAVHARRAIAQQRPGRSTQPATRPGAGTAWQYGRRSRDRRRSNRHGRARVAAPGAPATAAVLVSLPACRLRTTCFDRECGRPTRTVAAPRSRHIPGDSPDPRNPARIEFRTPLKPGR